MDRNRIKRIIREYFRTRVAVNDCPPLDFVVMARTAVQRVDNEKLRESLARHFRKIEQQVIAGNDSEQPVP